MPINPEHLAEAKRIRTAALALLKDICHDDPVLRYKLVAYGPALHALLDELTDALQDILKESHHAPPC